jgi:hypothetical protein
VGGATLIGGPLREVMFYIWLDESEPVWRCEALSYWDGSLHEVDGKRYIVTGAEYEGCAEPDQEELSCGHVQPVKVERRGKGRKYYNRRRRCAQCALEVPA